MKTQRRQTRLVPGSFQSRFLTVSILHYLAIVLTFAAVVFFPLMLQLDNPALTMDERVEFANQFLSLHYRVWPALLVVLVLLFIHLSFFSHRIAGPLYRCRQVVQQIAKGDLTITPRVRKGDYLDEEFNALKYLVSTLRASIEELKSQSGQLRTATTDLEKAVAPKPGSDVAQRFKALDDRLTSLEQSLQQFHTVRGVDEAGDGS